MTCDNDRCYGGNRLGFSWKGGRRRTWPPSTMVIRSEVVAGMRRSERGKGASFRRRLRATAATAPYRGKEGIHRSYHTVSGRSQHGEPPDRQIPSLSMVQPQRARRAYRQRALKLACRIFCCKRLALKDNDTVWYPALYHQRPNSRRGRRRLGDIHGHEAKSYLVIGHLRGEGSSRCR